MATKKDGKLRGILKKQPLKTRSLEVVIAQSSNRDDLLQEQTRKTRSLETVKAQLSNKVDMNALKQLYTPTDKPTKKKVTWKEPLEEFMIENSKQTTENFPRKNTSKKRVDTAKKT